MSDKIRISPKIRGVRYATVTDPSGTVVELRARFRYAGNSAIVVEARPAPLRSWTPIAGFAVQAEVTGLSASVTDPMLFRALSGARKAVARGQIVIALGAPHGEAASK